MRQDMIKIKTVRNLLSPVFEGDGDVTELELHLSPDCGDLSEVVFESDVEVFELLPLHHYERNQPVFGQVVVARPHPGQERSLNCFERSQSVVRQVIVI